MQLPAQRLKSGLMYTACLLALLLVFLLVFLLVCLVVYLVVHLTVYLIVCPIDFLIVFPTALPRSNPTPTFCGLCLVACYRARYDLDNSGELSFSEW